MHAHHATVPLRTCLYLAIAISMLLPLKTAVAETPASDKVGVLVTDWGTPDGMDFTYYSQIGRRSRIGEEATAADQPCTENFVGDFPYRSLIGVFPHATAFLVTESKFGDLSMAYDGYGIYWYDELSGLYTNLVDDTQILTAADIPDNMTILPARDIDWGRGRAIFDPDTRDGTDHLNGMYVIGYDYGPHPATGKTVFGDFANGIPDTQELDFAYWWRVVGLLNIREYADGPQMHPFTGLLEERLTEYTEHYFGDAVDIRFGMYEQTTGLTRRHEEVAVDFGDDGFTKLLLCRETTDNNNYANEFMTHNYCELALCRAGYRDEINLRQIRQVGRTPEYNRMLLKNLERNLERMNLQADEQVAIAYTTYGNPWPGTSRYSPTSPFSVSHPWVREVYHENAYYNYLNFKSYAEDALGDNYAMAFTRPGTSGDLRLDSYYSYAMFQPEFYTITSTYADTPQTESSYKNVREQIDRLKTDGRKQALFLLSHWYYNSVDNGVAHRDVNRLPFNSYAQLDNGQFWVDWCESSTPGDDTWTEVSPPDGRCSDPDDIHIMYSECFDPVAEEFTFGYATRIRGGVEQFGTFPAAFDITIDAQGPISKRSGGTVRVTSGPRAGAAIHVPADPDPDAPDNYSTVDGYFAAFNDPADPKIGAWFDFTAYVGQQSRVPDAEIVHANIPSYTAEPSYTTQPLPMAADAAGPAVYFGPYRMIINKPARISLPYDAANVSDPARLQPRIYNDLTRQWDPVYPSPAGAGRVIDLAAHTVTFDAQVLGIFCLVAAEEPTLAEIAFLRTVSRVRRVELWWRTLTEIDVHGFHVLRATDPAGPYARITASPITSRGDADRGALYRHIDRDVQVGQTYYYRLEEVRADDSGSRVHNDLTADAIAGGWLGRLLRPRS